MAGRLSGMVAVVTGGCSGIGLATVRLRRALEATLHEDAEVRELLDEVVARRLDPASAASAILARGAVEAGDAARPDQQAEATG